MPAVIAASTAATTIGLVALLAARGRPTGWLRSLFLAEALAGLTLGLAAMAGAWTWQAAIPAWIGIAMLCGFAITLVRAASSARNPLRRAGRQATSRVEERRVAPGPVASAILGGGVVATATALAAAAWLPVEPADRAMLAIVLWPLAWTGIACRLYVAR